MKICTLRIPRSTFDEIPEHERAFIVTLGCVFNDLNILLKCFLITSDAGHRASGVEQIVQVAQSWFFTKELVTKWWEAWEMLRHAYFSGLSKDYDPLLSPEAREGLHELKSFLRKKDNWFYFLRNSFGAHYTVESAKEQTQRMRANWEPLMFLAEERCNCMFKLSRDVEIEGVLHRIIKPPDGRELSDSERRQALDTLWKDVTDVTGWFMDFGHVVLAAAVERWGLSNERLDIEELPEPPLLEPLDLPYFTRAR